MEPNGTNENRGPSVLLCRMGCGFYGSLACDGMCSKCYKDVAKTRHENSLSDKMGGQSVSAADESKNNNRGQGNIQLEASKRDGQDTAADDLAANVCAAMNLVSLSIPSHAAAPDSQSAPPPSTAADALDSTDSATASAADCQAISSAGASVAPSDATATPLEDGGSLTADSSDSSSVSSASSIVSQKTKKNRCTTCCKKVGLTGFPCRCGGLYCSLHRYSDTHECTFNYKELGQEDIRKNNPVVVSEKVKKL